MQSDDVNINHYDVDSITFISFIVEIEREFQIEIPDGYLYAHILESLNGFINLIDELVEQEQSKQEHLKKPDVMKGGD